MRVESWSKAQLGVFLLASTFAAVLTLGAYAAWEARHDAWVEWSSRSYRSSTEVQQMAIQRGNMEVARQMEQHLHQQAERALARSDSYIRWRAVLRPLAFAVSLVGIPVLMLAVSWRWAAAR